MKNRIFTILFLLVLSNMAFSQAHTCGVTHADQSKMISFIDNFNKIPHSSTRSVGPYYVPVKFHMTAKNDGSGRVTAANVLNQMSELIGAYRELGFYLYIADYSFNYLNNTSIYENPGNFGQTIIGQKDPNALDIFICQNANTGSGNGGTVLGFYSPGGDYIIIRNQDVNQATTSLTHELGHFFSLPHTFYGWEGVYPAFGWVTQEGGILPWDPDKFDGMYTSTTCGGSNEPVEFVNQSNCTQAADRICDTPPDYNFGLGAGGCVWENGLRDRNGDVVDPQENNIMSYFGDCEEYVFTDGQVAVMEANFNSNARDHLQSSYIPDTAEIVSDHEILFPLSGEELEYFTNVVLDWTEADGATHYLVTINTFTGDLFEYIVEDSELFLAELEPSTNYVWVVRPFNDGYTNTTGKSGFFKTGTEMNTSVKESDIIQNVSVYPNPGRKGQDLNIAVTMEKNMNVTISLIDITGKLVVQENQNLNQGRNSIALDAITDSGIYILKLDSEDGSVHKKIVIQ